ncbi:hypothetical protein ABVK25_004809 [Lepraria finkii]|uniref:Uncharacterized protein n=1 Tax=Lepraria finkii TaxID=1340010 RepID=A0ABR4BAV4_9LECA
MPAYTYIKISITATASNEVFLIPVNLNYSDPTAILTLVQTVIGDGDAPFPAISETFDGIIAARYCPPEVTLANRSDMIQLFMSGVTENNLYWFGLGALTAMTATCTRPLPMPRSKVIRLWPLTGPVSGTPPIRIRLRNKKSVWKQPSPINLC